MLRSMLLGAAHSATAKAIITRAPVSREAVRRFVAGEHRQDAVAVAADLAGTGRLLSFEHLSSPARDRVAARRETGEYLELLAALARAGLAHGADLNVSPLSVGLLVNTDTALENCLAICEAAAEVGTRVTVQMHSHAYVDSTLSLHAAVHADYPSCGIELQAYLKRTEGDVAALTGAQHRVRLTKGYYDEPESLAYDEQHLVNLSYVRCLNLLMSGAGTPVLGTHDERLLTIARERAAWHGRAKDSFEIQMLLGVAGAAGGRLADNGYQVRVLVPYGQQWFGYVMRRLADRPANIGGFLRAALRHQ